MKRSLLQYLRCPATGESLELVNELSDEGGEIQSGKLVSKSGREYPISDGVPSLLIPEDWPEGQRETRESFSWKWKHAPDYRRATQAHYIKWYLERYGFGNVGALSEFLGKKTKVLDAGTGHGRDAELFATNSKATV